MTMHPLDHCVLPVADLAVARARYEALGFTVAPRGVHPFGTENACIYLADGTFLEQLAVGDAALVREAARDGNVFVARDARFRETVGQEGFSALVFGTADARADHEDFVRAGYSAGTVLDFSRETADPSGGRGVASFRLAFAGDERAPDCLFFTCQRVAAPAIDRRALQTHANGAARTSRIVLSCAQPGDFTALLAAVAGAGVTRDNDRISTDVGNGVVEIVTPDRFSAMFGQAPAGRGAMRLEAIVFGVPDMVRTQEALATRGVMLRPMGGAGVVDPAPGQGAAIAFEKAG